MADTCVWDDDQEPPWCATHGAHQTRVCGKATEARLGVLRKAAQALADSARIYLNDADEGVTGTVDFRSLNKHMRDQLAILDTALKEGTDA